MENHKSLVRRSIHLHALNWERDRHYNANQQSNVKTVKNYS